jgi:hypothetical protein
MRQMSQIQKDIIKERDSALNKDPCLHMKIVNMKTSTSVFYLHCHWTSVFQAKSSELVKNFFCLRADVDFQGCQQQELSRCTFSCRGKQIIKVKTFFSEIIITVIREHQHHQLTAVSRKYLIHLYYNFYTRAENSNVTIAIALLQHATIKFILQHATALQVAGLN